MLVVIEQETHVFPREKITVQGNSITSDLRRVDLNQLPFDIILGMPFLMKYEPAPKWRAGSLRFRKKFTWISSRRLLNNIHTISAHMIMQDINHNQGDELLVVNVTPDIVDKGLLDDIDESISTEISDDQREQMKRLVAKYRKSDSIGCATSKEDMPHRKGMKQRPMHWHMRIDLNPEIEKEPHNLKHDP